MNSPVVPNQQAGISPRQTRFFILGLCLVALYGLANTVLWYWLDTRQIVFDEYYHRRAGFIAYDALVVPEKSLSERVQDILTAGGSYPPMTYIAGAVSCLFLGRDLKAQRVINGVWTAVSLLCVFLMLSYLGCRLPMAILGVMLYSAIPLVIWSGRIYLNEAPLTAVVALTCCLLVADPDCAKHKTALSLGILFGLGMLTKWSYPMYVALPLALYYGRVWWPGRKWGLPRDIPGLVWRARWNTLLAAVIGALVALPFYLRPETWRIVETIDYYQRAGLYRSYGVISWALNLGQLIEGLAAPRTCGVLILLASTLGLVFLIRRWSPRTGVVAAAVIGGLACVAVVRKDPRWATPILPAMAVAAAYGLVQIGRAWIRRGLTTVLSFWALINLSGSWGLTVLPEIAYTPLYGIAAPFYLVPQRAGEKSWQMEEVATAIAQDIGIQKNTTGFMPYYFTGGFHSWALMEYLRDHDITLIVNSWSPAWDLNLFFKSQYIIRKTGDMGEGEEDNLFAHFLNALPESFLNDNFDKIADFSLKDDSTATLYRARALPLPVDQQIRALSSVMETSPTLAENPLLLVQLGVRLVETGQNDRFTTLTRQIPKAVLGLLDSAGVPDVVQVFLLSNYAKWAVAQDESVQTDFIEYLKKAISHAQANFKNPALALGEGYVLADFYRRIGRLSEAKRFAEDFVQRYPDRWRAWMIRILVAESEDEKKEILRTAARQLGNPAGWAYYPFFNEETLWAFCQSLAEAYLELNEYGRAETLYSHAANMFNSLAEPCISLALRVYYPLAEYEKALELWQEACRREPNHPFLTESNRREWETRLRAGQILAWAAALLPTKEEILRRLESLDDPSLFIEEIRFRLNHPYRPHPKATDRRLGDLAVAVYADVLPMGDPERMLREGMLLLIHVNRIGSAEDVRTLAESIVGAFSNAFVPLDANKKLAAGLSLLDRLRSMELHPPAESLQTYLVREYGDRREIGWLNPQAPSILVHTYDLATDPVQMFGCTVTTQTRERIVAAKPMPRVLLNVSSCPKPFPASGAYAIQLDLTVDGAPITSSAKLMVYLNTRSGKGPGGSDWGEFDAFSMPLAPPGQTKTYVLPMRSALKEAKFVYRVMVQILNLQTSHTLELSKLRLLRLAASLNEPEPEPEGFIPFRTGRDNLVLISVRRPISPASPLLLDNVPLERAGEMVLPPGEHHL
ncbi:MAG: phospholipid carrier-dependent glycosyltransferase, partial [Candidatus Sumerlaeia bacterium]|nr:phospholipid carrier-dependent glycosyltransferase [Candidatus Sumerlaeia bacterium]